MSSTGRFAGVRRGGAAARASTNLYIGAPLAIQKKGKDVFCQGVVAGLHYCAGTGRWRVLARLPRYPRANDAFVSVDESKVWLCT